MSVAAKEREHHHCVEGTIVTSIALAMEAPVRQHGPDRDCSMPWRR